MKDRGVVLWAWVAEWVTDRLGRKARYEALLRSWDRQHVRIRELERTLESERAFMADGGTAYLSGAEIERIAMLMEEAAEVVQICGKILRFGWESCSPFDDKCRPNRGLLERELGSVRAVVDLMANCGDVRRRELASWRDSKRRQMPQWTKHQADKLPGKREADAC
jgi:hypothetical protein